MFEGFGPLFYMLLGARLGLVEVLRLRALGAIRQPQEILGYSRTPAVPILVEGRLTSMEAVGSACGLGNAGADVFLQRRPQ